MNKTTAGKIFLHDQRGIQETDWFRCYSTFCNGYFPHPHKKPFGNLCVLDEDTLAAGHTLIRDTPAATSVILLLLVGSLQYQVPGEEAQVITPGNFCVLLLPAGTAYAVANPYEAAGCLIRFLRIHLDGLINPVSPVVYPTGIEQTNCLHEQELPVNNAVFAIGAFDGRQEAVYRLKQAGSGVYVLCLQGAFEVQGRLLHAMDGLALEKEKAIELEALSNQAIVLIVETGVWYNLG
jgi:redox-sensitive bicupin YhaK (pirin superfamily)